MAVRSTQLREPRRWLSRRLALAYLCVIGFTTAALWIGYVFVARALDTETISQQSAAAASAQLGAANDVLGYAVHIGAAPSSAMSAQLAAAAQQAIEAWQSAHNRARSLEAQLPLSPAQQSQLDRLSGRTGATFEDMLSVVRSFMPAVAAAEAGDNKDLQAAITRLATTEGAYADAVKAEGAFFDELSTRAALDARLEGWIFAFVALGIIIIGFVAFIAPATRTSARLMEQSIRSQEQNARIGSEVARHVAERDRREAEAQFQALFRHSSIGVALADEHGAILDSNDALQRMLGYPAAELLGAKFGEWAVPESSPVEPFARDGERVYRRKDGTTLWVEVTSTQAIAGDGRTLAVIQMVQDIEKRKKAEAQLQFDATHDSLTGLRTRGYFEAAIARAVETARRDSTRSFAVLMIDLDKFKHVNDTRGHAVGDAFLAEVGRRLAAWAGNEDVVGRYGGDEFAALLPDAAEAAAATEAAAQLHRILGDPVTVGGLRMRVSASIGICLWDRTFADGDAIMRAADGAAYRAKALGGARSVVYDAGMAMHDDLRRRVAVALRGAIDTSQLSLAYQPIVTLPERRCIGFEALIRWKHPDLGDIAPSVFIPVAEETGLMGEIGAWVLRSACAVLSKWRRQHGVDADAIRFNINVSPQQMADPAFPELVRSALDEAGLSTTSIMLELTETAMFDGRGPGNDTLAELRRMGTPIVLDDFGTGYSSLSYLQRLSMDALKVDQSFVAGLDGALASPAIVQALVTVAHSLGVDVVAEGVETWRQASSLAAMGCRFAQGFLFSPGLAADDALFFLRNNLGRGAAARSVQGRG